MFSFIKGVRERLSIIKEQVSQPSDVQGLEIVILDLTKRVSGQIDEKLKVGLHYPPAMSIEEMYRQKAQDIKNAKYAQALQDVYKE